MTFVQTLTLLTSSNTKWTPAQEKTITRDFPFADVDVETSDQFVARTYLQFLWLPESIMPINLLVPSLNRICDASSRPADAPHPLHTLLEPLLHSVRSVVAKYHTELPQILAQDGGDGESEESMMWYALGYEMTGEIAEGVNSEDAILLEEKARNMWLERLERREVQIQILLYLLKLSLPGPCTPLPSVTIPVNDVVPSTKKKRKKERTKVVVPSPQERLESFMDKLCTWQLVNSMNDASKVTNKDERDWMQTFCEDVVEPQFKSKVGDIFTLLRRKLFPHSPFSDEENETDGPSAESKKAGSRSNHKLARSSTSSSVAQSKGRHASKPTRRSPSVQSHVTTSDMRSRSRSLSVSLAQDASARRCNASGTASSLKRALSREVSMSRAFKPRAQPSQSQSQASQHAESCKVLPDPKPEKRDKKDRVGMTLVAATPMKRKVGKNVSQSRQASFDLESEREDDGLCCVEDEDGLWLPNSSPDVMLLGPRKRSASGSSSSVGLSDPMEGVDTPVKKRLRI